MVDLGPDPDPAQFDAALAAALLADADLRARLNDLLAAGAERRRQVWAQVRGMGRMDLEGLALGAQLPAAQTLAQIRLLVG